MTKFDPNILIALITSLSSIIVAAISIWLNNRLVSYKVDELQKKVEKHNNVVERTTLIEHDMQTVWQRYDDMKERVDCIETKNTEQYNKILELLEKK